MPSWNGNASFFGSQTSIVGPISQYRKMQERLPGVNGYRNYRLGFDSVSWTVTGRYEYATRALLDAAILAACAECDGTLHTFVDGSGGSYDDCELNDLRPLGPVQKVMVVGVGTRWICWVQATVVWTAPV